MKTRTAITLSFALGTLWFSSASPVRADWLAGGNPLSILDGQPLWRLADTNGAVVNRFANLALYHQEWTAMTIGPDRKVYVVRNGGDTMGESIDIYAPNGAEVGSIRVGPFSNGDL